VERAWATEVVAWVEVKLVATRGSMDVLEILAGVVGG
jgi:hypothetical protein